MSNKISVITVVFNDVTHIRETMESFFSQTWEEKEYIVIDGGSTDGTADIIREYADHIAYWCSEKDDGIYDAMNKGIAHCTGDWINFLNCGDYYASNKSLEQIISLNSNPNVDVIYGNSIEINHKHNQHIIASDNPEDMRYGPIYRHGSSLIKASIQKKYLFDLTKSKSLSYALDWNMIYTLFSEKRTFNKVDTEIQCYLREGVSDNIIKSLWLNYKVISKESFDLSKFLYFCRSTILHKFKQTFLYKWMAAFFLEYMTNGVLTHIPFWIIRRNHLRLLHMQIGKKSFIMRKCYIIGLNHIQIGDYSHINRNCLLDARGGIIIGNNVSISHDVRLITGSHHVNSELFKASYLPIHIKDYAWVGIGSTILQGVTIGKGAVVCAGSVVTKDVPDYTIVGGIPAKKIGERSHTLNYHCIWDAPFT